MFNHARTLLMNVDGPNSPGEDYLGEELVPRTYRKLELPTYLDHVRMLLFGSDPDRAMLNYRAKQFMTLLHTTELEQAVLDLDSRITYDAADENHLVSDDVFLPVVTQHGGSESDVMTIIGEQMTPDPVGRLRYHLVIDVLAPDTVEVKRLVPVLSSHVFDLVLTNQLSQKIDLVGTGYSFFINTDSPGAAWQVRGYMRPRWDLGQLAAMLEYAAEPTMLSLFGLTNEEPWKTFRELWFDHPELPYSLGGLLLAVIYRTEEIRTGS